MTGLELSRAYWETYGREMLEKDFPGTANYMRWDFAEAAANVWALTMKYPGIMILNPGFVCFCQGKKSSTGKRASAWRELT